MSGKEREVILSDRQNFNQFKVCAGLKELGQVASFEFGDAEELPGFVGFTRLSLMNRSGEVSRNNVLSLELSRKEIDDSRKSRLILYLNEGGLGEKFIDYIKSENEEAGRREASQAHASWVFKKADNFVSVKTNVAANYREGNGFGWSLLSQTDEVIKMMSELDPTFFEGCGVRAEIIDEASKTFIDSEFRREGWSSFVAEALGFIIDEDAVNRAYDKYYGVFMSGKFVSYETAKEMGWDPYGLDQVS